MSTIILQDFKIGLDRRRMNETSLPGSLVTCENAHITRGGEIEKSEALIRFCNLPNNTYGLAVVGSGYMTFGSDNVSPNILNSNPLVRYQRLNDGSANMIDVLCVDLFGGLPYVVAEYDDGIIRHWYNATKVLDMVSGKGSAKFTLSADDISAVQGVHATGSFVIILPTDGCSITSVQVDTVELLAEAVVFNEANDEEGFPSKVVDAINENSNASGFTASLEGDRKIVIRSEIAGTAVNGDVVSVSSSGSVTLQDFVAMNGGVAAQQILTVKINGVDLLSVAVDWVDSDQVTAAAVAAGINHTSGTHGYKAFSNGATLILRKLVDGTGANGHVLAVTKGADINISNSSNVSGGSATATIVQPGRYIKTFKNKMYALSESSVYYSEIGVPDNFNSGTGSGFDNLSNNTSGAEILLAMANYFENMAIFSRNVVQIWFMSDDPAENQQIQVLNNTGTVSPDSVTEFGDSDVFYLADSGVRSLRARDTTNAAFVNDVGVAIDSLIQDEILTNSTQAERARGFLEPRQGRFQMAIGARVYVFSFFPSSKISAWSTYLPGFNIEGNAAIGQEVIVRSRNALYKVGSAIERKYDARKVKVITPFFGGTDPSVIKQFTGIDIACQGTWDIFIATDPLRVDENGVPDEYYYERVGTVTGTTYAETGGQNGHMGLDAISSHISLKFVCRSSGYARIGNVAIHVADGTEKGA